MTPRPDLLLFNANAITFDPRLPTAELVAVQGDRISWVGSNADRHALASSDARVIDCEGQTLLPGFIDSHCHVIAYAASLVSVDCSPSAVRSIADIQRSLRERAGKTRTGQWIRGTGYDEFSLVERRHPSREDLDDAVPDHPVKLNHRSGHACVLNSAALTRAGISSETPDPAGGVVERDWDTGRPTGLLMEMDSYLDRVVPSLTRDELNRGVRLANRRLVSVGITSVQDATHSNTTERWDLFKEIKDNGNLQPRVTMMAGADHLDQFLGRGLRFGSGDGRLNLGAAKVMLTATGGVLHPPPDELRHTVLRARQAGFQVAIHAVEAEAVEAAVDALLEARASLDGETPHVGTRDRIEHCSECPPEALARLARAVSVVVTQPGFLYYSGQRYLSEVDQELRQWLYRVRSFADTDLMPAFGSDAPVIDPNPLVGVYAAVSRRSSGGATVGQGEEISSTDALRMYTLGGAYAAFQEGEKGSLEKGKLADLVLLDQDPTRVETARLLDVHATMTVIGGQVVWQA